MPDAQSTSAPAGTATTAKAASAPGGTNVFNNLAGRDPDLIYAGETIKLANGKTHLVKAGETLGGIAAANGMKLDDLIRANGMNASLLGKNSSGAYFNVGSAQPSPGSTLVPPPKVVAPTSTPDPIQPATTQLPKGDELEVLKNFLKTEASGDTTGRLKAIEARQADPNGDLSDADRDVLLGIQNDYRGKHPDAVTAPQVVAPAEPAAVPPPDNETPKPADPAPPASLA